MKFAPQMTTEEFRYKELTKEIEKIKENQELDRSSKEIQFNDLINGEIPLTKEQKEALVLDFFLSRPDQTEKIYLSKIEKEKDPEKLKILSKILKNYQKRRLDRYNEALNASKNHDLNLKEKEFDFKEKRINKFLGFMFSIILFAIGASQLYFLGWSIGAGIIVGMAAALIGITILLDRFLPLIKKAR